MGIYFHPHRKAEENINKHFNMLTRTTYYRPLAHRKKAKKKQRKTTTTEKYYYNQLNEPDVYSSYLLWLPCTAHTDTHIHFLAIANKTEKESVSFSLFTHQPLV